MELPLLRPRMAGTGAAPARALPLLHAAEVGGYGAGGEGRRLTMTSISTSAHQAPQPCYKCGKPAERYLFAAPTGTQLACWRCGLRFLTERPATDARRLDRRASTTSAKGRRT